jgi:hypothetical protein
MLTHDIQRVWELGEVTAWPLAPQSTLFQGAAVGDNGSGYARPLQAGDKFIGFCEAFVSNLPQASGAMLAPEENPWVRALTSGLVELDVSGVKASTFGAPVYASDDTTFTGPPNSVIGTVHRLLLSGKTLVAFGHYAHATVASHRLLLAGSHKTTGGNALEKIALPGLLPSDLAQVQLTTVGKKPCLIQTALPMANSLHITFDNDPGSDHLLSYLVYRPLNEGEKK